MLYNLITILGATASGKTTLAARLADELGSEIISADSRQIYRGMNIGTGKDLDDYIVNGKKIPYHLIDIADAGYKYNVFEFQKDFITAFETIQSNGKLPILCGGTGMYIESVLKGYRLLQVPVNQSLRDNLKDKSLAELTEILQKYKDTRNNADTDTPKRAIRAIEIAAYTHENSTEPFHFPTINSLIIGIEISREERREKISQRLKDRMENGMIEEVEQLLKSGISPEDLIYYGLEYKFLTLYAIGQLTYEAMFSQLECAIHQFAKRQATWFRGMEKRGFAIHWIDVNKPIEEKITTIKKLLC